MNLDLGEAAEVVSATVTAPKPWPKTVPEQVALIPQNSLAARFRMGLVKNRQPLHYGRVGQSRASSVALGTVPYR